MRGALHILFGCVIQARTQPHALADRKRDDGWITTKLVDCGAACREFIAFRHGLQETAPREDYSTHGCLLTFDKGPMKPGSAGVRRIHRLEDEFLLRQLVNHETEAEAGSRRSSK